MPSSIIYGPVPSWRLGRSLGIDLLSTSGKTCDFNCIYCQLGHTTRVLTEPEEFVSLEQLTREIESVKEIEADYATFSGMGEPTLASNLGEAINIVKPVLDLPVAVLTNSSLMFRADVRQRLIHADVVVAKLDAPNDELLRRINRPAFDLHFDQVVEGIKRFRDEYKGKLALQMMFVEANRDSASEMAMVARRISPDEIQLNTPLRPCAVEPLTPSEMASIKGNFDDLGNVATVYEVSRPEVTPLDLDETLRRRPEL